MCTMSKNAPIFIIGIGRTGSTALHSLLCNHPRLAWLSEYICNKYPHRPIINKLLMYAIDLPVLEIMLKKKFGPGECYRFWDYYFKGFSQPCRDLVEDDVTIKIANEIDSVLRKMTTKKRNRMLIKITGWPRIGFLHEIFKEAKFIHIIRDGRAVVNSMINTVFWRGWMGPYRWRYGELNEIHKEEWERYNRSFVALAAIQWKIYIDALERAKKNIPDKHLLEIKYEDLCLDHKKIIRKIMDFCGLESSRKFDDLVLRATFKNTNYKWQQELTSKQQTIINEILAQELTLLGFNREV